MAEIIKLLCPNLKCRALLSVPGAARGKTVRCGQCGVRVRVPLVQVAPVRKPAPVAAPSQQADDNARRDDD